MIHIASEEMKMILDILSVHAEDCDVFVFGSRYNQSPKKFSDLDLAFVQKNGEKLGLSRKTKIEWAFSESDLPYLVDVVDYHACDSSFRKIIDSHCQKIYSMEA